MERVFSSSVSNQFPIAGVWLRKRRKSEVGVDGGRMWAGSGWRDLGRAFPTRPRPAAQVCADRTTWRHGDRETDGMWSRLPVAHELSPGWITPTSWFGPGYDTSREHSFFFFFFPQKKRRSLKRGNKRVKTQTTVGWLLHRNTYLWPITGFTLNFNPSCHQFSTKANPTVKHSTVPLGREIPPTTLIRRAAPTPSCGKVRLRLAHADTHTWGETETQRQVLKAELF